MKRNIQVLNGVVLYSNVLTPTLSLTHFFFLFYFTSVTVIPFYVLKNPSDDGFHKLPLLKKMIEDVD